MSKQEELIEWMKVSRYYIKEIFFSAMKDDSFIG
jgi:hypothetical protein